MSDTSTYIQNLRAWWPAILAIALVAGVAGFLATTSLSKPEYRSTTTVALGDPSATYSDIEQVRISQELAPTYAELVEKPLILDPVIEELSLKRTARNLAKSVNAKVLENTSLIEITVTADTRARAGAIADTIATQLTSVTDSLQPAAPDNTELLVELDELGAKIAGGEERLELLVEEYLGREYAPADPSGTFEIDASEARQINALQTQINVWRNEYNDKLQLLESPATLNLTVVQPATEIGSSGGLRSSVMSGGLAAVAGLLLGLGGLLVLSVSPEGGEPSTSAKTSPQPPSQEPSTRQTRPSTYMRDVNLSSQSSPSSLGDQAPPAIAEQLPPAIAEQVPPQATGRRRSDRGVMGG